MIRGDWARANLFDVGRRLPIQACNRESIRGSPLAERERAGTRECVNVGMRKPQRASVGSLGLLQPRKLQVLWRNLRPAQKIEQRQRSKSPANFRNVRATTQPTTLEIKRIPRDNVAFSPFFSSLSLFPSNPFWTGLCTPAVAFHGGRNKTRARQIRCMARCMARRSDCVRPEEKETNKNAASDRRRPRGPRPSG